MPAYIEIYMWILYFICDKRDRKFRFYLIYCLWNSRGNLWQLLIHVLHGSIGQRYNEFLYVVVGCSTSFSVSAPRSDRKKTSVNSLILFHRRSCKVTRSFLICSGRKLAKLKIARAPFTLPFGGSYSRHKKKKETNHEKDEAADLDFTRFLFERQLWRYCNGVSPPMVSVTLFYRPAFPGVEAARETPPRG